MLSTALPIASAVALFSVLAFSAGLAAAKAANITSNESNAVGTATCAPCTHAESGSFITAENANRANGWLNGGVDAY